MQSFTIEEFKKIHQVWKESGLCVRDYYANIGIKKSRFYYWKKRVVDGYAGYGVFAKLEGFMIMCCWAHCRRYFDWALKSDKLRAEYGLDQIG